MKKLLTAIAVLFVAVSSFAVEVRAAWAGTVDNVENVIGGIDEASKALDNPNQVSANFGGAPSAPATARYTLFGLVETSVTGLGPIAGISDASVLATDFLVCEYVGTATQSVDASYRFVKGFESATFNHVGGAAQTGKTFEVLLNNTQYVNLFGILTPGGELGNYVIWGVDYDALPFGTMDVEGPLRLTVSSQSGIGPRIDAFAEVTPVPEPATMLALGAGLVALLRRRQNR